jgi:acetyltransferase-like isoleucine patch superfamily enzyme
VIIYKEVEFVKDCLLSWDVLVMNSDVHSILNSQGVEINPSKAVRIGEKVLIGARCTLLKGTQISSGSVIASGSLVSKKLTGENKIFGGNPVKES